MHRPNPVVAVDRSDGWRTRRFGIVSTFPPTACGIATFSAALANGLIGLGATVEVVRCGSAVDGPGSLVTASLAEPASGVGPAVAALDRADTVIVQHEYGIFGGADGDAILPVLEAVTAPMIVVAHTVLGEPSAHQLSVLRRVCAAADAVVVMTESARTGLLDGFGVDPSKVSVIPHGAATPLGDPVLTATPSSLASSGYRRAPRLLTWGLLGPGKGIEWAVDAVASLADVDPRPHYLVAGATHPKVLARSGEAYRSMLQDRVRDRGAGSQVSFDDGYRDLPALTRLVRAADLVVLPYDSRDQVTSGVLVDAVAAGRPVVSTAFPHAVELLAGGAGLVVPQRDPVALAEAIRRALTEPGLLDAMAGEARRLAPELSWTAVARRYDRLAERLQAKTEAVSA